MVVMEQMRESDRSKNDMSFPTLHDVEREARLHSGIDFIRAS